jgi:hypothetical protein
MTFRRSLVDLASRPAGAGGSCSSSFCFSRWAPSARLALRATLSPSVRNIQGVIVCLAVIPVSFPLERLEPATGHQPFAGSPFLSQSLIAIYKELLYHLRTCRLCTVATREPNYLLHRGGCATWQKCRCPTPGAKNYLECAGQRPSPNSEEIPMYYLLHRRRQRPCRLGIRGDGSGTAGAKTR